MLSVKAREAELLQLNVNKHYEALANSTLPISAATWCCFQPATKFVAAILPLLKFFELLFILFYLVYFAHPLLTYVRPPS